ncbi:hypothetical protein CNEO2_130116 [Clostridium neonatale]|uniref:DUF6076 domain-containing protein n=1 Tax=Clostridium neonatale TaxID=137838 RepID=UPI00291C0A62|nr:DUF6076 domain-containing protein [Clostridium neonatale]CAI3225118.1 hypothetical protein CNEO2_130116 [Clostridium neonatale]
MIYTIFNKDGYTIRSDEWNDVLNNTEGYNWLFDFLAFDLIGLSEKFEKEKISLINDLKKIDRHTFDKSKLKTEAIKIESIHPFYKKNISKENHPFFQFSEGVKYLTKEVLFKFFDEITSNNNEMEIWKNIKRYTNIINFFNEDNINYLIMEWNNRKFNMQNVSNNFLADLIMLQQQLCSWSYIFLDVDAKYLNKLNKKERISMYSFYSNSSLNLKRILEKYPYTPISNNINDIADISVTENLYFSNVENNVSLIKYEDKVMYAPKQIEIQFKILMNLVIANNNQDNEDIQNTVKNIVENYNKDFTTDNYLVREIVSQNLLILLKYEFSKLIDNELMIRKCKSCGKYFIINNNKSFYCTRNNVEIGVRCCDEDPKKRHVRKLKELGIYEEYNEIQNKISYRQKRKYKWQEKFKELHNELIKVKEKLMKYNNVEKAKKSKEYEEFFKKYKEIKNVLEENK